MIVLFLLKAKTVFRNGEAEEGLTYKTEVLGNLVNRDTDTDGIPDWEEGLWGTDPTKAETTPGVSDKVAIEKLKSQNEQSAETEGVNQTPENLTQTDNFAREFFATVATLNQNGAMDQATIEKLSSTLAEKIKNSVPRKIFLISDVKVGQDNSAQAIKNYRDSLNKLYQNYPIEGNVLRVLQKFIADPSNIDSNVLLELDPIILQTKNREAALAKMSVPQSFSILHLELLNALERLVENLADIKLYDTDIIVALGGISQYEDNNALLTEAVKNLDSAIAQKLNN